MHSQHCKFLCSLDNPIHRIEQKRYVGCEERTTPYSCHSWLVCIHGSADYYCVQKSRRRQLQSTLGYGRLPSFPSYPHNFPIPDEMHINLLTRKTCFLERTSKPDVLGAPLLFVKNYDRPPDHNLCAIDIRMYHLFRHRTYYHSGTVLFVLCDISSLWNVFIITWLPSIKSF